MSVIYEITDLSEFNRNDGPALWFVWCEETGDAHGSDALTWQNAVAEVARYCDTGTDDYPKRWRYTAGDGTYETLVERRMEYDCGDPWAIGVISSSAFGTKEVRQRVHTAE